MRVLGHEGCAYYLRKQADHSVTRCFKVFSRAAPRQRRCWRTTQVRECSAGACRKRRIRLTQPRPAARVYFDDAEVSAVAESVYKVIELVGTSTESWEKAAAAAVEKAATSLRDLRIAEVAELDLQIENGRVKAYRAKVKVSFKYED